MKSESLIYQFLGGGKVHKEGYGTLLTVKVCKVSFDGLLEIKMLPGPVHSLNGLKIMTK